MRNARWLTMTSGLLLAAGAASYASGCGRDAESCDVILTCPGYAGSGGAAHVDPARAGQPMGKDAGPRSGCGIFTSPTAPAGGDGSMAAPFSSLQAALDQARATGQPVFACGKEFAEKVHVPGGVVLYGALD